ncbi:MAG: right-handed parallel beta-helix repeat-containing protein [Planctomycetota bacterium]
MNHVFRTAGFIFAITLRVAVAVDIQLAPGGPISTPQAARDAARAAAKPARIIVGDGIYVLTEAITLSAEDSQVSWEAAPNAKPVFSGGLVVSGWKQIDGGIWSASLPDVREGKWSFEQLWVNGQRATRARSPNKGFFHIAEATAPNVFPGVKDTTNYAFSVTPENFAIFAAIPPEQRDSTLITVTHAWAVSQARIKALDEASHSILIKGKSRYKFVEGEPDQRYWMENFRAALDAPGEWFLDKQKGELLYIPLPGEDMTKVEIIAPVADKFVVIKGAKDVRFKGLNFTYGDYAYPANGLFDGQASVQIDGAIDVEDSSGIRIENCDISRVGRHAIFFRNGCSDSSVTHCNLHDLGGSGALVGESNRPSEERVCNHIVIDDCIIQHGGRLHPSACGVTLTHVQHCVVSQCDIGDFFYTGVSVGWNWGYGESISRENKIENNHIHHLGWAYLSDMGGFYGLGTAPGTIIRGNHIHHVASHRYGGWGLYNDEGSADVLMENNLVHDTSNSGFHQHYGYANRIRNNIFAFGRTAQIQRSRNEGRLCIIYERNIVVWDPASPLLDGGEAQWKVNPTPPMGEPRDSAIFRKNLYWPTDGKIPELLAHKWTWSEWQQMGRDHGSFFANPLFEDIAKRDFRLKPDSPASKIGFKPWDLTVAGVRADGLDGKAWRELAAKGHDYPTWDAEAQPWRAPDYTITLQDFETAALGSIGIRNASYKRENKGESIGVSDEAASPIPLNGVTNSKRSLKFQDAPGLAKNFDPLLEISTKWDAGTIRASFDAMSQPGADWFFEMRTHPGGEYGAGPMIWWRNGGVYTAAGGTIKLVDVPPGEWFRVAIVATTGAGHFDVTVTRQDGSVNEFKAIACKPTWNKSGYLIFSSIGITKTAYFIDNVSLTRADK